MARIWSDEGKLAAWLEVELAATASWAELGVVPDGAATRIAGAAPPSAQRVAELEATLQHDTAAFVDAVAACSTSRHAASFPSSDQILVMAGRE